MCHPRQTRAIIEDSDVGQQERWSEAKSNEGAMTTSTLPNAERKIATNGLAHKRSRRETRRQATDHMRSGRRVVGDADDGRVVSPCRNVGRCVDMLLLPRVQT